MKNIIISTLAIFVAWSVIDYLIHGMYLHESYLQTADLWRSVEDAKMLLNSCVVLIAALVFSLIYIVLIDRKTLANAVLYGCLMGVIAGIGSYGFYAFSPIPYHMAMTWFLVSVGEGLVAGGLLGVLAKN